MPEPNENSKPWWQSKTIWGLAITAVSVVAPKYAPIANSLPPIVDQVGVAVGLILGVIGRIKANKTIGK